MAAPTNRRERRRAQKMSQSMGTSITIQSKHEEISSALQMAMSLRDRGQFREALELCVKAVNIEPDNKDIHFIAGTIQQAAGKPQLAVEAYRKAMELSPDFTSGLVQLAECMLGLDDFPEGIRLYKEAIEKDPGSLAALRGLGQAYLRMSRFADALPCFETAAKKSRHPLDFANLATAMDNVGRHDDALKVYEITKKAGTPAALVNVLMGRIEATRGNFDVAEILFEQALKCDANFPHAHLYLANELPDPGDVQARIAAAESSLEALGAKADTVHAAPIHFALARLHEKNQDYSKAFPYYVSGNKTLAAHQPDQAEETEQWIAHCKRNYTAEFYETTAGWGHETDQPVFVFGLPRSGTTLVEQIIAAHGDAEGAGEVEALNWAPFYLKQALTPERVQKVCDSYLAAIPPDLRKSARVVDKSISSYLRAGLILMLFPNAHLINCRRHPMDTAFSIYTQMFDANAVVFSSSLERIVRHYRAYEEIMSHWHKLFPGRILDVRYEALVNDPEAHSRNLIAHIGLEWDPACLAFHTNKRSVRTASIAQAREPIYKTAMQKWKSYEEQLVPLKNDLADIIADYEAADPK